MGSVLLKKLCIHQERSASGDCISLIPVDITRKYRKIILSRAHDAYTTERERERGDGRRKSKYLEAQGVIVVRITYALSFRCNVIYV